jgi:hypothetical protein
MTFLVTVRTAMSSIAYTALAPSSFDAWDSAAEAQGDTVCSITVTPAGRQ